MKKKYIVYYHYLLAGNTTIEAYSPAEAEYITKQRLKRKGYIEPGVDKVISKEEEKAISESSERMRPG